MAAEHSTFSASAFARIAACPGSLALAKAAGPSPTNKYAAEGTAAHYLLEALLTGQNNIMASYEIDGHTIDVDDEMLEHVRGVADEVLALATPGGVILTEQRVTYAQDIDVPASEGWGTADVVIIRGTTLYVVDFKYGRGVVVDPTSSMQLRLYALGALNAVQSVVADIDAVVLVIAQPRAGGVSAYSLSVDDLNTWARTVGTPAAHVALHAESRYKPGDMSWEDTYLHAGEDQCRWCPAKATCPALRQEVAVYTGGGPATADEFESVSDPKTFREPDLARAAGAVDLIEDWCKAVRAEVERRLLAGTPVAGYKLVQGRQGNRQWTDEAAAEAALKTMRLKVEEMYDLKLISPTTAEKLAKASTLGPRQWSKLQSLITRKPGAPSVAPVSDPRPALTFAPVEDDFVAIAADLA